MWTVWSLFLRNFYTGKIILWHWYKKSALHIKVVILSSYTSPYRIEWKKRLQEADRDSGAESDPSSPMTESIRLQLGDQMRKVGDGLRLAWSSRYIAYWFSFRSILFSWGCLLRIYNMWISTWYRNCEIKMLQIKTAWSNQSNDRVALLLTGEQISMIMRDSLVYGMEWFISVKGGLL